MVELAGAGGGVVDAVSAVVVELVAGGSVVGLAGRGAGVVESAGAGVVVSGKVVVGSGISGGTPEAATFEPFEVFCTSQSKEHQIIFRPTAAVTQSSVKP